MFDADDLEVVRMGAYPLSDTAVTDIYDVIGRYAAVDIVSGDILLTEKVSQVPFQDGEAMSLLPEGYETAVAMVQIMEGSEVTALQTGDIIKMNGYDDGLIDIPALNFVRVITAMGTKCRKCHLDHGICQSKTEHISGEASKGCVSCFCYGTGE